MADIFTKIRKNLEEGFEQAKKNAIAFRESAGEYSRGARLKLDLVQLKNARKKKMNLLGKTVYPFLLEQNIDGLKGHQSLSVLVDDIKLLESEITLTEKSLEQLNEKSEGRPEFDKQQVRDQIRELEFQIEKRLKDLKEVKKSLGKDS